MVIINYKDCFYGDFLQNKLPAKPQIVLSFFFFNSVFITDLIIIILKFIFVAFAFCL